MSSDSVNELRRFTKLVSTQWPELAKDDCNSLDLVLPFLDSSSVGNANKYPQFLQLKDEFTSYLKASVNEYYDAFNESVGAYGITTETISDSQSTLSQIQSSLVEAKESMNTPLDVMKDMISKLQQQAEISEVLERISEVKASAEAIESCINEKQFKKAQIELSKSYKSAERYKLWQIPALSSVKEYLDSQSRTLFDSLCEEINNICYLKFGDLINSVYEKSLRSELNDLFANDMDDVARIVDLPLNQFLNELNSESEGYAPGNDSSHFKQLKDCLDVVKALGKLPEALQLLVDRTTLELQQMFSRCVEEIRLKYPDQLQMVSSTGSSTSSNLLDLGSSFVGSMNASILNDLFSGIFKKCTYAIQCHAAIKGIVLFYAATDQQTTVYDLRTVWKRVEKEVSSIIYGYIVDETIQQVDFDGSQSTNSPWIKSKNNDPLADTIFQFTKINFRGKNSDQFEHVLQDLFPGQSSVKQSGSSGSVFIENESFHRRATLVSPSVFNMSIIVNHFLYFIGTSSLAFHEDNNIPLEFFDHFMHIVFLSQLESTLVYQSGLLTSVIYSSEKNNDSRTNVSFRTFFNGVLKTLNSSLYYREPYVNIILKIMSKMVDQFFAAFEEMVPSDYLQMVDTALIPHWLKDEKLRNISSQIVNNTSSDKDELKSLVLKELELSLHGQSSFKPISLINEQNLLSESDYKFLTNLLDSLKKLLAWLPNTKRVTDTKTTQDDSINSLQDVWKFMEYDLSSSATLIGSDYQTFLTLNSAKAKEFDALVANLEHLSLQIKLIIRYDIRCKAIWNITEVLAKDIWMPSYSSQEIEWNILKFNKEVVSCNNYLTSTLSEREKNGILLGLPILINNLFIRESGRIIKVNFFGITKVLINIRVIQQMLRNVMEDPSDVDFSKSIGYFELFKSEDKGIIEKLKSGITQIYTLDEMKNMVRLIFSESMAKKLTMPTSSLSPENKYRDILKKLTAEYQQKDTN